MQSISPSRIFRVWSINQSLGFSLGWLFHGVISHLLTGEHEHDLSLPQLIMHNVSLLGMAGIFFLFQNRAAKVLGIQLLRYMWLYLLIPTIMFWAGYYGLGMPMDIVLSFFSIALLNGIIISRQLQIKWWTVFSLLSALMGIVVGTVIIMLVEPILVDTTTGVTRHTIIFFVEGTAVAVPMAVSGGWLLRRCVIRQMKISI